ncbi:MAG: sigma-70 family RNA polymerase sigma factor, partial [Nostoc sp.]
INRIDEQPAPPDIPLLLEEIRDWAQTDADGELRNTIFRRRPEINAQALILQRLPPETPWRTLAENFQLNPAEAKDLPKFYSRRCLPLLRIFGLK